MISKKDFYRQTVIEEHLSLMEEPWLKYLGHVTPQGGSAKEIKTVIVDFFPAMVLQPISW